MLCGECEKGKTPSFMFGTCCQCDHDNTGIIVAVFMCGLVLTCGGMFIGAFDVQFDLNCLSVLYFSQVGRSSIWTTIFFSILVPFYHSVGILSFNQKFPRTLLTTNGFH